MLVLAKDGYDWIKQKLSGNSSGTSLLFRKQYGGQGLDEPAQFGGAAYSGKLGKYQQLADAIAKDEGTYTSVNTGGNPDKRVKGDFQSKNIPKSY